MSEFSFIGSGGKQVTVSLRDNTSDYESDDLMQMLETALLALPSGGTANRVWFGHFFQPAASDIKVCFARYAGKKDKLVRVERIGSTRAGGHFRIRIKSPQDSLTDLEFMGAAGSVGEESSVHVAQMPAHWRTKLLNELFTSLKVSASGRTVIQEAHTWDSLPEVRALGKRVKPDSQTRVTDAWLQLKGRREWYLSDQGTELDNYVSLRVANLKYLLRRAEIVEDQKLIEALQACITQLEALRAAIRPLSIYSAAARKIITSHQE